ncbi:1-acyl-sn-glycerol-3-phosphate acyltransferase [Nonomuraea sp. 3-1Str]|uniref:lysophospholipid acyltransferase family protein n=1 Tax=Nonomuraea sp. 3-1Str TaxID=2929801 RepID=UPI0028636120|nr:lysophospholipid acyltransferase family protein [Nonomuraea sp. 3-1Str]MDR8410071.1 1-acyl-sn-glycerol-3-phosphate acyltransferase [Nonomuraea sp. 3-1Str]
MLYQVVKFAATPLAHVMCRPHISGAAHVPRTGPAILAANHLSVLDSFLLPALLPRPVTFVAKNEYFSGNPVSGWFMRLGGSLPIDRDSAHAAQAMLDAATEVLERGELFGIHPEGTRSPDGRLYRGKIGVAWLALRTGAPVLPVALSGTEKVLPVGAKVPRPARIGIRIGEPMTFDGDHTKARDRRQVTDEIMAAIQKLSGQEYVPAYAASVKSSANGSPEAGTDSKIVASDPAGGGPG